MPKMNVVIDKSFLQGGSKDRLQSLFENHRVLMTQALFYELLTTEPAERARCFRRIPAIENPVVLVYNVGPILRWEVKYHRPLSNIGDMAIDECFQFNPGLLNEDFDMGEEQARHLEKWRKEMSVSVSDFADHCRKVTVRFPELRGYCPGTNTMQLRKLKNAYVPSPGSSANSVAEEKEAHGQLQKRLMNDGRYIGGYRSGFLHFLTTFANMAKETSVQRPRKSRTNTSI